jgi:hypothetical protein
MAKDAARMKAPHDEGATWQASCRCSRGLGPDGVMMREIERRKATEKRDQNVMNRSGSEEEARRP